MIIPVTLKPPPDDGRKLPPQLADLGNGNIVLIELQGTLDVQGSADSQFVGTLEIDPRTVCALLATIQNTNITLCCLLE
jgi:chromosome transmission fidelity protein 8